MQVDALFKVRVKTNAKEFRMKIRGLTLFLDVTASPKEGEANKEIIKQLKRIFNKSVEIVKGHKSREKLVLIHNLTPEEAKRILDTCEQA